MTSVGIKSLNYMSTTNQHSCCLYLQQGYMPHVLESSDLVVSFMSELSSHFLSCLAANHLPWFCSCDYSETEKDSVGFHAQERHSLVMMKY